MLQELSKFILDTNDAKILRSKAIQFRRLGRKGGDNGGVFLVAASMMKQKAQQIERANG